MSDEPDIEEKVFEHPDGTKFSIGARVHLALTEDKIKAANENQARLAAASPHVQLSPQMAAYERAVRELPMLLERHEKNPTLLVAQQIAECYATQGLYAEALEYTRPTDTQRVSLYLSMAQAIERPDDEECGPECAEKFKANQALLTQDTLAGSQFSHKHGKVMPVVRCAVCGGLNVRPLPETLAKQMNVRAQARELTKGLSANDAKARLSQNGLTPDKVFN